MFKCVKLNVKLNVLLNSFKYFNLVSVACAKTGTLIFFWINFKFKFIFFSSLSWLMSKLKFVKDIQIKIIPGN